MKVASTDYCLIRRLSTTEGSHLCIEIMWVTSSQILWMCICVATVVLHHCIIGLDHLPNFTGQDFYKEVLFIAQFHTRPKKVAVFNWGCATSGCCLEALKCTETYGIQNNHHHRCLNCTEFLNYVNGTMKYNS